MFTKQLEEDLNYTYHKLSPTEREKISGSTIYPAFSLSLPRGIKVKAGILPG